MNTPRLPVSPDVVRMAARAARGFSPAEFVRSAGRVAQAAAAPLLPARSLAAAVAGRTVLVTGASYGIGHAAALQVADAGATTIIVARTAEDLDALTQTVAERGGIAHPYVCDLSDLDAIDAFTARLRADGHTVDVLVNNAARSIRRSIADSYDRPHDFQRTMQLNYLAPVRLSLAVLPGMAERGGGHIVNISTLGTQTGSPRFSAYLASKAALEMFSRIGAAEYLGDGVRFSIVHMPLVRTPMVTATDAYENVPAMSPDDAAGLITEALRTRAEHVGPRLGQVADVAHAVSPAASTEALHALFRATGTGAAPGARRTVGS